MRRIRTAALIAKNTRKLGSVEVWSEREIDFLVEMGTIARGSREEFERRPCFVTAKETISPLFLDANAAAILLALARRGLPCTIIPMPLSGLSSPVTKLGNAIMANAEVLGVITAVKAVHPEALAGGGSISGVLDMATGVVSFSSPEAILQDIAVAEVHERLYGFDYLIGTGYTDARYPNPQVLAEKLMKFLLSFLSRRCSYPVGLLEAGAVFSDLQALVDLELCRYIHAHFGGFGDAASVPQLVGLIARRGHPRQLPVRGAHPGAFPGELAARDLRLAGPPPATSTTARASGCASCTPARLLGSWMARKPGDRRGGAQRGTGPVTARRFRRGALSLPGSCASRGAGAGAARFAVAGLQECAHLPHEAVAGRTVASTG